MCKSGINILCLSPFLILILFSNLLYCEKIDCGSAYTNTRVNQHSCYVQVTNTGPCEIGDTEMVVKDRGEVDVTFTVTSRNCSLYKLQLKVNESMNEINCVSNSGKHITKIQSEMDLSVHDKLGSSCEEMVNVTFEDLPSGCYKLYYCTVKSESSHICRKLVKYLNTNIQANEGVEFVVPNLTPHPIDERNEVGITVSNYTRFTEIQLTVRPDNNTQFCNSTNSRPLTTWVAHDVNRRLMCRRTNGKNCYMPLTENEVAEGESCNKIECYEEQGNSINCVFKNIPPGNYCVHMIIDDPSCTYNRKDCNLFQTFEMKAVEMEAVESTMAVLYISLPLVIVCILIVVLALVLIFRKSWGSVQRVVIADDDHSWIQSPEILLLYPRDCKPFMDLMNLCGKIIEERTGCKVYDCFDPNQSEDLSLNKMDWMRKYILCHNVKVVVVETACAALHQKAPIQHNKLVYNDPTWLDNLFLTGLRVLTDNLDRNNYQRVFVIRFEGFSEERDTLDYLTTYTRYVIPRYLDQLLTDLHVQNVESSIIKMKDDENENVQKLEDSLKNLINYRQQNPGYLQRLLSIT